MSTATDDEPDPFSLLGLPVTFELDPEVLRQRVLRLSLRLHPDRAPDPVTAELQALELAAINEAAHEVENDERRAEALLRLLGGPAPSEDRTLPDGFLESILDVRLELEEAVSVGDEAGKSKLQAWAEERRKQHRSTIAMLFDSESESIDRVSLVSIRHELNVWRYIERMLLQLSEADRGSM